MWRGDAGTSVEGTNDGAAGMDHAAGKEDGMCGMGGSDRKEVMYTERGDEE